MAKFILTGNGPCLNRGCEAILRTTVDMLSKEFSNSSFMSCPHSTARILDEEILTNPKVIHKSAFSGRRTVLRRILHKLKTKSGLFPRLPFLNQLDQYDAVLAVGGDNFSLDYGSKFAKSQFDAGEEVLAKGKPFVIWGATIGPFTKEPEFEKYAIEKLKRVSLITARDPLTVEYLASHGVSENVLKVADPAFVMEAERPVQINPADYGLNDRPIGINFSPLIARYLGKDAWFRQARESLLALDGLMSCPIVLVPHVVWEKSSDHEFLTELLASIGKTRNPVFVLPDTLNSPQLKWCLSQLQLFVGARTHATVGALSKCVPTISIGYSMKSRGINIDIFGNDNWVIDSKTLTAESITNKVHELHVQADQVRQHLTDLMPEYKAQAFTGAKAIRQLVT